MWRLLLSLWGHSLSVCDRLNKMWKVGNKPTICQPTQATAYIRYDMYYKVCHLSSLSPLWSFFLWNDGYEALLCGSNLSFGQPPPPKKNSSRGQDLNCWWMCLLWGCKSKLLGSDHFFFTRKHEQLNSWLLSCCVYFALRGKKKRKVFSIYKFMVSVFTPLHKGLSTALQSGLWNSLQLDEPLVDSRGWQKELPASSE